MAAPPLSALYYITAHNTDIMLFHHVHIIQEEPHFQDFRRTVIQTGSEVILVGAERKKREIRLPGRYRGTTVWAAPEFPENVNTYFEPPELPHQPGI